MLIKHTQGLRRYSLSLMGQLPMGLFPLASSYLVLPRV